MGYTHYWYRPCASLDNEKQDERFEEFKAGVQKLIETSDIPIAGPWAEAEPEFGPDMIRFNGRESYEDFIFTRRPIDRHVVDKDVFAFTKTSRYPYDEVVCACLILAKEIYGNDIDVESDGDWDKPSEWGLGRILFEKAFGRTAICPLSRVTSDKD